MLKTRKTSLNAIVLTAKTEIYKRNISIRKIEIPSIPLVSYQKRKCL